MVQDDYDEDPGFYSTTMQARIQRVSSRIQLVEDNAEKTEEIFESCNHSFIGSESDLSRVSSSSEKWKAFPEAQLLDIEESSEYNSKKGTRIILGPFGARRTCYHYRPQVKRCVTSPFYRTSFRKVLLSYNNCCNEKQQINCPRSSSVSLVCCEQIQPIYRRWCPKLPYASKKCCLHQFCHHHFSTKSTSRVQVGSVTHRFSYLTRKKKIEWRASMRPCTYERVMWRLPSSLWKQLALCLVHFEEVDMNFLTPVMFSLRRFSGLSDSRMVYSLSRDSYGVSERAWEDFVMALCLCCVLVFMYRVYGGVHGCVSEVLDWITW